MRSINLFGCAVMALLLMQICSCNCEEACTQMNYKVELGVSGFSENELDAVILKTYEKDSGFMEAIDSVELENHTTGVSSQNGSTDTFFVYKLNCTEVFDYRIEVRKGTAAWYHYLKNPSFGHESCRSCSKKYDIQVLKSYELDGNTISDVSFGLIKTYH